MKSFFSEDQKYMMQALKLASCGLYTSNPNPAVGCVIVRDGKILGQGFHHCAGFPHAEIMALEDASYDVKGATVYVTLEPCSHYGRTPPCAVKLVECGVKKVVAAAGDPNPKVNGRGFGILRDAGIEVVEHVLEEKALFQNRAFRKSIVTGLPYVTVKVAQSIDGKTALKDGSSKWITNSSSRSKVQDIRAKCDCILTSSNTVIADDPLMNVRIDELKDKYSRKIDMKYFKQPLKVVLDTHKKLDISSYKIFREGRVLLVSGGNVKEPEEVRINEVVTQVTIPEKDQRISLTSLLQYLGSKQIRRVLVEAGSTLVSSIISEDLEDELYLFTAPKFLGRNGRNSFNVADAVDVNRKSGLNLYRSHSYDGDSMLHYIKELF